MSTDTPSPATPAPTDRGDRMSTPTPEGQYYVHSTAHPIVGGPVSHDEAIAALGALDNAYVQLPSASARRRDTADVIERARCLLAESYDGIDPDVETRHDGAVANLAAAGLLAVAASPAAPQAAQAEMRAAILGPNAGDRPRFWWSPSQALIRGGSRDTVPADAVELVPRTAVERLAAPADDEAAQVERVAIAIFQANGSFWPPRYESQKDAYRTKARAALAALKEGQKA